MTDWLKIPNTNFHVVEFVPLNHFQARPDRASRYIAWKLVEVAQNIRNHFGKPMTINNKAFGGTRDESGLRLPGMKYYTPTSDHSYGHAIDFLISGLHPLEVRVELAKNYKKLGMTMIEDGMNTWNHASIAWIHHFKDRLAIVDRVTNIITTFSEAELQSWKAKAK